MSLANNLQIQCLEILMRIQDLVKRAQRIILNFFSNDAQWSRVIEDHAELSDVKDYELKS